MLSVTFTDDVVQKNISISTSLYSFYLPQHMHCNAHQEEKLKVVSYWSLG